MMPHHSMQSLPEHTMEKVKESLPKTDSNLHQDIDDNTMSSTQYEYNTSEICNKRKRRIDNEINRLSFQATHAKHSRATEENRLDKRGTQVEHLHQLNRNDQSTSTYDSDFHLTNQPIMIQDAISFLNAHDPLDHKWSDFEKNPTKSLLLWYVNAGCFAFDECKEYSMSFDGKQIDTETLKNEIAEESLSDQELANLIKTFHRYHSYTKGNMYSCACCGYQQLEQKHPNIEYIQIRITDEEPIARMLRYNENQTKALHNEQHL